MGKNPELREYRMFKLILQLLVENPMYHGLVNTVSTVTVQKTVSQIDTNTLFIEEDGIGIYEQWIRRLRESDVGSYKVFALKKKNNRIQQKYGKNYGLRFYTLEGKGSKDEVLFPVLLPEKVL